MISGTQIAQSLVGRTPTDREKIVLSAVFNGEVPRRLSDPSRWCHVALAGGRLVLTVSCRPVELGTDADPFLVPMRPDTAQAIADRFNAILPSCLIVDAIWRAAALRLPIRPPKGFRIPGPDMVDPRSWLARSREIEAAIAGREVLVAGGKKDVVVGPKLDGTRVAIYSTPFSGAGPLRAPGNHQPYYVGHTVPHVDYSHAVRLVRRTALLDGLPIDLLALFQDPAPARHGLVSDQGPFLPRFPNASSVHRPPHEAVYGDHDRTPRTPTLSSPPTSPPTGNDSRSWVRAGLGAGAGILGAIALGVSFPAGILVAAGSGLLAAR